MRTPAPTRNMWRRSAPSSEPPSTSTTTPGEATPAPAAAGVAGAQVSHVSAATCKRATSQTQLVDGPSLSAAKAVDPPPRHLTTRGPQEGSFRSFFKVTPSVVLLELPWTKFDGQGIGEALEACLREQVLLGQDLVDELHGRSGRSDCCRWCRQSCRREGEQGRARRAGRRALVHQRHQTHAD